MSFESLLAKAESSISNKKLNSIYDGDLQLEQIGVSIPPQVRALEMRWNVPRLAVDVLAEALNIDGFEGAAVDDEVLRRLRLAWSGLHMDALAQQAHTEALVQGEAFLVVGPSDNAHGVMTTVHSRDGVAVEQTWDGQIEEAVVTFQSKNDNWSDVVRAVHYMPGGIDVYQQSSGLWGLIDSFEWVGRVPVIPLRNVSRVGDRHGRSDMDLVIDYGNAGSRTFTLLQLATEMLSLPQKYILGGDRDRMKRPDGSAVSMDDLKLGAFLLTPSADSKVGQLAGADLNQITLVIKSLAQQVSAMTGIPPQALGLESANPASAEAMRVAKDRLISRGEKKQAIFSSAWEEWAKVVCSFWGVDLDGAGLSPVWRDIASPSASAKAQALLQAHAQGVVSARTARDGLQLTPEQAQRENAREDASYAVGSRGVVIDSVDDGGVAEPAGDGGDSVSEGA